MQCYIVTYNNSRKTQVWPRFTANDAPPPSREAEIAELGDRWLGPTWLGGQELGDYLEITGPWPVPEIDDEPPEFVGDDDAMRAIPTPEQLARDAKP